MKNFAMSENEIRSEPKRTITDEEHAANLFTAWAKTQVSHLTKEELEQVRELLKLRDRVSWVVGSLKTWAIWLVAIVGACTVGVDSLKKILLALIHP